ncbi:unnamed protein product, partial [Hymenolepis diminuta]
VYTPNKDHIRHILLFQFRQGNKASLAAKTLKHTYATDVLNEKTCRRWFSSSRFKQDDFDLKDESRTGDSKLSILSNWNLPLMEIKFNLHYWRTEQNLSHREMKRLKGWEMSPKWEM